jgi:hypothetical protein
MDSSPLVRPRHISISVRPIRNFFMSAVEVKLNRSFCAFIDFVNGRRNGVLDSLSLLPKCRSDRIWGKNLATINLDEGPSR